MRRALLLAALAALVLAAPAAGAACPGADPCPYLGTPTSFGSFYRTAFVGPIAPVVDGAGNVYTVDYALARVSKQAPNGTLLWMSGYDGGSGQATSGADGFYLPYAAVLTPDGSQLLVADLGNHRIARVSTGDGSIIGSFGTLGSGNGQFNSPTSVTVDRTAPNSGEIYVADYGNGRIQHFTAAGAYVDQFAVPGVNALDMSSLDVLYATTNLHQVLRITIAPYAVATQQPAAPGTPGTGDAQFFYPSGLALDEPNNDVWVSDTYNHRLQRLDATTLAYDSLKIGAGTATGASGAADGEFNYPYHADIGPCGVNTCVYSADYSNSRIQRFRAPAGSFDGKTLTPHLPDALPLELAGPGEMARAADGNVWIADTANSRVVKIDADGATPGTVLLKVGRDGGNGGPGSAAGELNQPLGIAVDAAGKLYVADWQNHRVSRFNGVTGSFETNFGSYGTGDGQLNFPNGVGVGPCGTPAGDCVFVADTGNNRVTVFNAVSGAFVRRWGIRGGDGSAGGGPGAFNNPTDVEIDAGKVWVVDRLNSRLQAFTPTGTLLAEIGGAGTILGTLDAARYASVTPGGALAVADEGNDRVQVFEPQDGGLIAAFGEPGAGAGRFSAPRGIVSRNNAQMLISDAGASTIQRFTFAAPLAGAASAGTVGVTHATLNGMLDPQGGAAGWAFEYGPTTGYGTRTAWRRSGPSTDSQAVSASLADLQPATTYHARLVARTPAGTATSSDFTFTTQSGQGAAGAGGAAGSNGAAGASGALGSAGANGAAGPAGPAGANAKPLASCRLVKAKRKKGQKAKPPTAVCTVKLAAGARASVRLVRNGVVVARGTARGARVTVSGRVAHGRYKIVVVSRVAGQRTRTRTGSVTL